MRKIFWLALLLFSSKVTVDQLQTVELIREVSPAKAQAAQAFVAQPPASPDIYFTDISPDELMKHAKLSTVPMVVLFYEPNNKACDQQLASIQDVGRGWLKHLRFYRLNTAKHKIVSPVPMTIFLQPDSTGYPVLLNQSGKLMNRTQTHDFMTAALKLVKSTPVQSAHPRLPEIAGESIADAVIANNCPAVVLFIEEGSFTGILSEQVLMEGASKYNQQAMFFRCTDGVMGGFIPGHRPSTYSFKQKADGVNIAVEQVYGLLTRENMEKLLKKLPAASPNNKP